MSTTWLIRKGGSNTNGGTSPSVRSTGTDGATNVGNNTLTAASASWTAGDIGQGINIASNWRLITAVASGTSLTYSGSPIATATGRTWTLGGSFLTIGKALGLMAAGDTLYPGAGTYREVNALPLSGSAGNVISVIGDVDGVVTGDPGDVIISGFLTDDKTAGSTSALFSRNGGSYFSFSNLILQAYGNNSSYAIFDMSSSGVVCRNITVTQCLLQWNQNNTAAACHFILDKDLNSAILFDRCGFDGPTGSWVASIVATQSSTADYDSGWEFRNCFAVGSNSSALAVVDTTGAGSFRAGGGLVNFCTAVGYGNLVWVKGTWSNSLPVRAFGNICRGNGGFIAGNNQNGDANLVEDYNLLDSPSPRSGDMTIGPGSVSDWSYAPTHETFGHLITGRNPRPFYAPMAGSPLLGFIGQPSLVLVVGVPTTTTDDATVGTISWTNPNNSQYGDNAFATAALAGANQQTHYLNAQGFGFALPSTATVLAIRVEVGCKSGITISGGSIRLIKGGVIGGNDYAAQIASIGGNNIPHSYGGALDLWGNTLLYSDVNAATFGVAVSFKQSGAGSGTMSVDLIRIIVTYSDSSVPTAQTQDMTSGPRPAGGGSVNPAIGAFERGNTAILDSSTFRTAAPAVRLDGPGYIDEQVAVDTTSTSVSVYARYNGSYTGTLPTMAIVNGTECGVANTSTAQVGAANTWEQLALNIAPAKAGVITLRFWSQTTAAAGSCWFDDWTSA